MIKRIFLHPQKKQRFRLRIYLFSIVYRGIKIEEIKPKKRNACFLFKPE
jgi:hypothetical protein